MTVIQRKFFFIELYHHLLAFIVDTEVLEVVYRSSGSLGQQNYKELEASKYFSEKQLNASMEFASSAQKPAMRHHLRVLASLLPIVPAQP